VARHCAGLLLADRRVDFGIEMVLHKEMPVGSGLGSSAASSVAAVVAVNALLPRPLSRGALLPFAVEGERLATGAAHADNAAPALLGGVCLVRDAAAGDILRLPVRRAGAWAVVHPHLEVATRAARGALPDALPLETAVRQWANVGALVAAILLGDLALMGRSIEDGVAEPVRARFIPGFEAVKRAALEAGALASSISGSGPSLFALCPTPRIAREAGTAMARAFREAGGVASTVHVSGLNRRGAVVSWLR
jgi:homoserine kinase